MNIRNPSPTPHRNRSSVSKRDEKKHKLSVCINPSYLENKKMHTFAWHQ